MKPLKEQKYCDYCDRYVLAYRYYTYSNLANFLMVVLTMGLFLPLVILQRIYDRWRTPWTCPVCGSIGTKVLEPVDIEEE